MRTAEDFAADTVSGAADHKRRATALRRLAGGLKAESGRGFDAREREILARAVELLQRMAEAHAKAQALAARRIAEQDAREKAVRVAMAGNFFALTTIADKVALVAAVSSYLLRSGQMRDTNDLEWMARDALDSLAYTLAGQSKDRDPAIVVNDAWEKFQSGVARLKAQYHGVIDRLSAPGKA